MRARNRRFSIYLALLLFFGTALQASTATAATSSWEFETGEYRFSPAPYGAGPTEQHVFTLTNTGEVPIRAKTWGFRWSTAWQGDPTSFPVISSDCKNRTLEPDGTCTIEVAFSPLHAGGAEGAVMVKSQEGEVPIASVKLFGTGTGPTIPANPGHIDFGSVEVGTSSAPQVVTLEEQSSIYLYRLESLFIEGADEGAASSGPFKIVGGSCAVDLQLDLGKTCSIEVAMAPSAPGAFRSELRVVDVAPDSPQSVTLTGTGVAALPKGESTPVNPGATAMPAVPDPSGTPTAPPAISALPAPSPRHPCPRGKRQTLRHRHLVCIRTPRHGPHRPRPN